MQLAPKYRRRRFRAQRIFRKNRRAGKAELAEFFKFPFQVFLRFAKLRAVAFIKDKHHFLVINRQIVFRLHQIIQLLNGGDDDFVVVFIQITLQARRALRTVDAIRRKALVFLYGLII